MFDNQTTTIEPPRSQLLSSSTPVNAQFPEPLKVLFSPKRTKVLYGGRGAGRSWGCARALLLIGSQRKIRVLCVRELQNSIAESVHKLLSDQIELLGLSSFYKIEKAQIFAPNGTTFSFEGIKNNTNKIKSYEGVDYCWVEEANKVTRASWMVLIPTIRKKGSEIWITFNPELKTDYTYQKFVLVPDPDNTAVVRMNWRDNPWFGDSELVKEKDKLKKEDYDAYLNVWEGECLEVLEGAVFGKELRRMTAERRLCDVPWDRETPVDTYWDLGRRDFTAIWFAQRVGMQYRLLAYYENTGEDINHYLRYCQRQEYTYGTFYMPHDASAKVLGIKRTIAQITRGMGFTVHVVPRVSQKVNAINAARIIFPTCWFDENECIDGVNRLRHYTYKVETVKSDETGKQHFFSKEPEHDENSHAADAFMTMAQSIKGPTKAVPAGLLAKLKKVQSDLVDLAPNLGWMR